MNNLTGLYKGIYIKKTLLLLPILISSCAFMIVDKPNEVKDYYTEILQGELGCTKEKIEFLADLKTSGLCGSVDTMKIKCKSKTYICTVTSSIIGNGITVAGITQSSICRPQTKCKEETL